MRMEDWLRLPDENQHNRATCRPRQGWRKPAPGRSSFLYAMECDGAFKVGVSDRPDVRQATLQMSCPRPITIARRWPIARNFRLDVERYVHELLRTRAIHGEWFDATLDEVSAAVDRAMAVHLFILQNPKSRGQIERPLTFLNGELDRKST